MPVHARVPRGPGPHQSPARPRRVTWPQQATARSQLPSRRSPPAAKWARHRAPRAAVPPRAAGFAHITHNTHADQAQETSREGPNTGDQRRLDSRMADLPPLAMKTSHQSSHSISYRTTSAPSRAAIPITNHTRISHSTQPGPPHALRTMKPWPSSRKR